MADLTQQYLDILRGYGVDTSQLQYADPAKLKRIVDQTRQAPDTGGGAMAVGQQAAQQAAKDVIGGTTPRKSLEDLLKEAHTGPSITQAASEAVLPMSEVPAMSAPRELSIRQHPGGPQPQGDIDRPTSLGVKTSTATLRPDKVASEVAAPKMDYDRQVLPDKIAGEVPAPEMDYDRDIRPDKIAGEVPAPDMTFEDNELEFDPTRGRYQERPFLMEETVVTPQPEEVEDKPSFLSRLGGFAKDNPELLAQIAQAGGGLMQDIAQGRAQKAADAKTRGAMAQSNLIGALTGGKSRPAVMREEAEQGGLLARLGQAVEAGGRVAGGEMKRRTALSQRDEEMGLKGRKVAADELNAESQKAYREAMAGVYEKQLGVDDRKTAARLTSDYLKAAENQRKESRLPVKQITELASQFSTLNKLDSLEDFIVGADFSALEMGPLSLDEPSQFIFGTDPRVAQGKIQGLIMEIAQSVPGVLTEQDQKRLEQILFTMNDRPSTALDIADAFRQAKIEGLTTQLGGLKEAGGYDVSYFERQIQDYGKDKGEEGLIKLLQGTKLELE